MLWRRNIYWNSIFTLFPVLSVAEFEYEGLCEALKQLAYFEKNENSRVVQSGVLKGLNLEDIKRASQHLIFQDGCRRFFQNTIKSTNFKTDVHVLSYCWCGDLIRSAFASGILSETYKSCIIHFREHTLSENSSAPLMLSGLFYVSVGGELVTIIDLFHHCTCKLYPQMRTEKLLKGFKKEIYFSSVFEVH